ncbi:hypothetical protein LINGRAHAP2_LOCUS34028 [Linum grandiflorum]
MEYYYYCSSSSSSKKLMMIAITITLLLTTTIGAVAGEEPRGCSTTAPVDSGVCKGYYLYCVTELITSLITGAPSGSIDYITQRIYPIDQDNSSGGVHGEAICAAGSYRGGCRNCLLRIKETLNYYCSNFEGGFCYNRHCSIKYHQNSL